MNEEGRYPVPIHNDSLEHIDKEQEVNKTYVPNHYFLEEGKKIVENYDKSLYVTVEEFIAARLSMDKFVEDVVTFVGVTMDNTEKEMIQNDNDMMKELDKLEEIVKLADGITTCYFENEEAYTITETEHDIIQCIVEMKEDSYIQFNVTLSCHYNNRQLGNLRFYTYVDRIEQPGDISPVLHQGDNTLVCFGILKVKKGQNVIALSARTSKQVVSCEAQDCIISVSGPKINSISQLPLLNVFERIAFNKTTVFKPLGGIE